MFSLSPAGVLQKKKKIKPRRMPPIRRAISKTRAWVCTFPNPPPHWEDLVNGWVLDGKAKFVAFQEERGAEGADNGQGLLHGQIYVILPNTVTLTAMRKLAEDTFGSAGAMHFEPRMGTHQEALTYCTKEDTRVRGPWITGEETTFDQNWTYAAVFVAYLPPDPREDDAESSELPADYYQPHPPYAPNTVVEAPSDGEAEEDGGYEEGGLSLTCTESDDDLTVGNGTHVMPYEFE